MAASLAFTSLTGCAAAPLEKIVPYVRPPEELLPGKPIVFATSMASTGYGLGLLVESHEGRPTKIEGNPEHPASLGATDVFAQAAVLSLYDPDRSQVVSNAGRISTWNAFLTAISVPLETQRLKKGAGLRVLTETVTSPTLASQLDTLRTTFPLAEWHQYEPVTRDTARSGARLAFGEPVNTLYHFDKADIVLALEADFLSPGPGSLRYAHDFTAKRQVRAGHTAMNRLYVIESTPSLTGAMADHRLPLRPSMIAAFADAVARELGVLTEHKGLGETHAPLAQWAGVVARDLQQHRQ